MNRVVKKYFRPGFTMYALDVWRLRFSFTVRSKNFHQAMLNDQHKVAL